MSNFMQLPAYVNTSSPIPNVKNYAGGVIFYFMETSVPYGYALNPAIQGVWGPCANYDTVGDVVINHGVYSNYRSINHLLVRQGPIENRGVIDWIYLERGPLVNFGAVNHLYVKEGHVDNFGIVFNLYKVRNDSPIVVDLAINQDLGSRNPYGPNSYVNQYFVGSSWSQRQEAVRSIENVYDLEYEPVDSSDDGGNATQVYVSDTEPYGSSDEEYFPAIANNSGIEVDDELDADESSNQAAARVDSVDRRSSIHALVSDESIEGLMKGICCRICFEQVKKRKPVSTHCGHIYCKECLLKAWHRRRSYQYKCPTCNMALPQDNLYHRIFI